MKIISLYLTVLSECFKILISVAKSTTVTFNQKLVNVFFLTFKQKELFDFNTFYHQTYDSSPSQLCFKEQSCFNRVIFIVATSKKVIFFLLDFHIKGNPWIVLNLYERILGV